MGNLVAPALARRLQDVGVSALTIHGRYGEQGFRGAVDLAGIRAVVAAVRELPVIGNGDVRHPNDVRKMINLTGCDGVMIGRRALSDPWIFRDAHSLLSTGFIPPPPTRLERLERVIEHFENMVRLYGERQAVINARKWMTWQSKAIGPCPTLRRTIPSVQSVAEFHDLVGAFRAELIRRGEPLGNDAAGDDERALCESTAAA
jgi:tRNA-dihydrouridine synthase